MVKSKLATTFIMIGLIGLVMSCSRMEQIDHDEPVKPQETKTQIANRLQHTNGLFWSHKAKPIKENVTN